MEEPVPTLLELSNRDVSSIPDSVRTKAENCFGIGSLSRYDCIDQVGEGTYGYVYKGKDKLTNETVALKRLILHRESHGFPQCAVREIKFLKSLQHKNIVQLKDVVTSKGCEHVELPITVRNKNQQSNNQDDNSGSEAVSTIEINDGKDIHKLCGNLYFVFEFVDHDLGGLIDAKYKFSILEIKCIMKQLFEVLDFLSERKIVHRDIKSSNILISNRHQLKLADFGLARSLQAFDGPGELKADLTNNVITIWYRPPELLLGAVRYSSAVDMWSAGCVLAELELGRPIFPGKTEPEQFDLICRAIGSPTEEKWSTMSSLPHYELMVKSNPNKFANTLRSTYHNRLSDVTLNILDRILVFDPSKRSSAKVALSNKYFLLPPLPPSDPTELDPMSIAEGTNYHEYKTKQLRKQKEEESKRSQQSVLPEQDTQTNVSIVNNEQSNIPAPTVLPPPMITNQQFPQAPRGFPNHYGIPPPSLQHGYPPRGMPHNMNHVNGRGFIPNHHHMPRPLLPPRPELKPGPFINRHYVPPPPPKKEEEKETKTENKESMPEEPKIETIVAAEKREEKVVPRENKTNNNNVTEAKNENDKFRNKTESEFKNKQGRSSFPSNYNQTGGNYYPRDNRGQHYGNSGRYSHGESNDYYTSRRERDDYTRYRENDRSFSRDSDSRERKRRRDSRDRRDDYYR